VVPAVTDNRFVAGAMLGMFQQARYGRFDRVDEEAIRFMSEYWPC
jgi:hypothetical protein